MNSVIRITANNPDSKIHLLYAADKHLSGVAGGRLQVAGDSLLFALNGHC
ncbi:MAG: hypothetical protein ABIJ42_11670 [Acidobacteriota bacterium]